MSFPATGSHVSAVRRLLRPKSTAEALSGDPQARIYDLVVVGTGVRRCSGVDQQVVLLRHPSVDAELFGRRVRLEETAPSAAATAAAAPHIQAAAAASAAQQAAGAGAVVLQVDVEDDIDDDLPLSDDEDELPAAFGPLVPGAAPPAISGPAPVFGGWGPQPVNITAQRSTRAASLHFSAAFASPEYLFLSLFPDAALDRIVSATNKQDPDLKLSKFELLAFFGLLMVACDFNMPKRAFWESPLDDFHPMPPFARVMSRRRFESISSALRLTDTPEPQFEDRFHPVRELIEDWNNHIKSRFTPSGTVCLDESMVTHNNNDVPGFVYVARKPNPVGNEYHTICDAATGVMFHVELVEGANRPTALPYKYSELGKTVSLVLRMTESLQSTGTVVIMDSAFCVLQGLAELGKRGVFAATVVKKKKYWPRGVPGDEILAYMEHKPVGQLMTRLGSIDEIPMLLHAVNHSRYVFIMISTYGSSVLRDPPRTVRSADGQIFTYRRNEPLADYYQARHAVDDHNHLRQGQRSHLEQAWASKFWPNRQLAFILSTTLVNAMLVYNHFTAPATGEPKLGFNEFRAKVARGLIRKWEEQQTEATSAGKRARRSTGSQLHQLLKLRVGFGAKGERVKKKYQQVRCRGDKCINMVRTYCSCDSNLILCASCFRIHIASVADELVN